MMFYFCPLIRTFRAFRSFGPMVGMALGGWLSGVIFDATGSYRMAFATGIAWNALNAAIALMLLVRATGRRTALA
jgi:hypothetical protein